MTSLATYEVHACKYARLERKAYQVQISADPHDAAYPLDFYVWVAFPLDEHGRRKANVPAIVVDTGFNPETAALRGREVMRDPGQTLRDLGVQLDQVKDVIVTHLHFDHAGGWALFPNANFHLQDEEMRYATGRHMCKAPLRRAYDVEDVVAMVQMHYKNRVVFHNGDDEIAPGLSVHHVGGHTAGLQAVRVWTRGGWLVLASDASHYYWGFNQGKLFSIVYSAADMLAGYDKLHKLAEGRAEMLVPGHDQEVMTRYPASSAELQGWAVRLD